MTVFEIIQRHSDELIKGLGVTLALCGIIWSASFVLGSLIGVLATRSPIWIGMPQRALSAVLAGVPAIVFLFWLHYPAQAMLGIVVNPFITACVALSSLGIFMVADTVRMVLVSFPRQYEIAGRVCGLTDRQILTHIKAPIIFRQLLPNYIFIAITLFQMTLFASFISVDEIFRVAQRINSVIYRPIEVFTALAVLCVAVCVPMNMLAQYLGKRFTRDLSER
jgi:ABC-type amino acid transport system permease subunit